MFTPPPSSLQISTHHQQCTYHTETWDTQIILLPSLCVMPTHTHTQSDTHHTHTGTLKLYSSPLSLWCARTHTHSHTLTLEHTHTSCIDTLLFLMFRHTGFKTSLFAIDQSKTVAIYVSYQIIQNKQCWYIVQSHIILLYMHQTRRNKYSTSRAKRPSFNFKQWLSTLNMTNYTCREKRCLQVQLDWLGLCDDC